MKYPRLAVYNTGFGLSISEYDGPEVPAYARRDFLKIAPPDSHLSQEDWDAEWEFIKKTANALVEALNEKNGYSILTEPCEYCELKVHASDCIARED